MDFNDMLIDALKKQNELLKARSPDHHVHCDSCGCIVDDPAHYRVVRKGLFKVRVYCEACIEMQKDYSK